MVQIYLFYGLSFILLGVAALLQPADSEELPISKHFWLLGLFGLLHGSKEIYDAWVAATGASGAAEGWARVLLLVVSFLPLFEFGRRAAVDWARVRDAAWAPLTSAWIYAPVILTALLLVGIATDRATGSAAAARYLFAFPGAVLAGLMLRRAFPASNAMTHVLGIAFFGYALVGALITERVAGFPSWLPTAPSFLEDTGIPVQLLRAVCAFAAMLSLSVLVRGEARAAVERVRQSATRFQDLAELLERRVEQRTAALQESEERLQDFAGAASDWLWETDDQHQFIYFSAEAYELRPSFSGPNVGSTRFDRRLPIDRDDEKWRQHRADLDARRPFKNFEYPGEVADGSVHHIRVNGRPVFSRNGEFVGYRGTATDITEQIEASSKLRENEAQLANAQRIAHLGNWMRDYRTDALEWSDEVFRIFGYAPRSFQPDVKFLMSAVHPDDLERKQAVQQAAIESGTLATIDHRIVRPNGEVRWVHQEGEVEYDENGRPLRTLGTIQDITERKREEEKNLALIAEKDREAQIRQLAERERDQAMDRLTEAIESISEGFAIWASDDRLVMCNSRYLEGYQALSDVLLPGVHFEDFLRTAVERGVYDPGDQSVEDFVRDRLEEHRNPEGAYERLVGEERWMRISKHRTDSGGIVGIWTDITENKKAEETIRDLALKDPLTGLANRNEFHQCLTDAIATARHLNSRVALLFLDLDRFKQVNDETGHPGGDTLLKQVAQRFTALARDTDTVARLGGDEFAIIMTGAPSADTSSLLAKRIIDSMAQPFSVYGREITIGTSIGISIYPDDNTEVDGLIRKADMALYQAKYLGRGICQIYDEEMHSRVRRGRTVETELRTALARGEFVLHYQPQLDITGTEVVGAEALIRWQHSERGLLAPGEFIDIAETSGLIVEIGKWVLGEACAQCKRWSAAGLPALRIAVNISARQFKSDDLVETVRGVLDATGIEPSLLELEITESMVMHDVEQTAERLAQLTDLGLEISIDDFGTGYSSLAYLKQFPVQRLKIDQTFVAMLDDASDDAAIVDAVIRLGHSLSLKVTAEGVETSRQLAALRDLGCDEVQGYFFAKPMSAAEYSDWLRDRLHSAERELSEALT